MIANIFINNYTYPATDGRFPILSPLFLIIYIYSMWFFLIYSYNLPKVLFDYLLYSSVDTFGPSTCVLLDGRAYNLCYNVATFGTAVSNGRYRWRGWRWLPTKQFLQCILKCMISTSITQKPLMCVESNPSHTQCYSSLIIHSIQSTINCWISGVAIQCSHSYYKM